MALQTAVVGGVVAWFGPAMDGPRFALLMAAGGLVAVLVAVGGHRVVPPGPDGTAADGGAEVP